MPAEIRTKTHWPWHWILRSYVGRWLLMAGMKVLPPCQYRRELNAAHWTVGLRVQAALAAKDAEIHG